MNEHALGLLDFARVREATASYCLSEEGREALLSALPLHDAEAITVLKDSASAILAELRDGRPLPELAFPPVKDSVRGLSKEGHFLEVEELYGLALWSESAMSLFSWLGAIQEELPSAVATELSKFPALGGVPKAVWRIIHKDGSLKDLPELKAARERVARINREIATLTESFFRNPETRSLLQSDEPTLRDGRTVLALNANFKGRIKGIVHSVSSTGQTVFVEPEELVSRNNDLVQEEARYRMEVARILREASEAIRPEAGAISRAREILGSLDGLVARAREAKATGRIFAAGLPSGFVLRTGRHPALGPRAVPIDVELPEGTRTLIITGPNTGGKTVTLKTIGLLALMNQFGLALPAGPGTGFAVFDAVFADIGDEQSIDQSLSTFSGHMRTIASICGGITGRSLVLLDELGSGTDPEEGSAVAMGLLDFFIARKSLTILTTHHGILKNYGYTRPGCLNACMDFDAASLQPTYRVLMGVPGESRALDIAAQHGLPDEVVAAARGYLDEERADVSELIKGLSERHRKLEDLESERKGRLREAMDSQRRADLASLRVRQREIELREEGVSGLKRQLSESRKTLENLVRGLREGGITPESTHEVKAFLGQLAVLTDEAKGDLERFREDSLPAPPPVEAATGAAPPFGPGVAVLAGSARRRGVIVRAAKKGHWLLETDTMRLALPESELTAIANSGPVTKTEVAVELAPRGDTGRSTAVFELDLRGFRLAAAIDAVEKQVDAASLQGLSVFTLLHGTGEGILGKGIHDYLKTRAGIADYHFARPEEGGYGKTVVSLQ
ncbi:MAG: endonuclease MutS2 [Rectinemataceae bacterium]